MATLKRCPSCGLADYTSFGILSQLNEYYRCKKTYYEGSPIVSDKAFDLIESRVRGQVTGTHWEPYVLMVGYDSIIHEEVANLLAEEETRWKKERKYYDVSRMGDNNTTKTTTD